MICKNYSGILAENWDFSQPRILEALSIVLMSRLYGVCSIYWVTSESLNISFRTFVQWSGYVCTYVCLYWSSQPLFSFKYLAYFVPTTWSMSFWVGEHFMRCVTSCNYTLFPKMCFCNQNQTYNKYYLYLGVKKDKIRIFHCTEDSNRYHKDCNLKSLQLATCLSLFKL